MPKYKIYAGLGGGFGGSTFRGVEEFNNEDEAYVYAHELSCEEYGMYAGLHGLIDYEDIYQDMVDDGIDEEDIDEGQIELEYEEERDSWLDFEVIEVPDNYKLSEEEEELM